jgi:hypothetical protein
LKLQTGNGKRKNLTLGSRLKMKLQIGEDRLKEEEEAKSQNMAEEEAAYLHQEQEAELEANP